MCVASCPSSSCVNYLRKFCSYLDFSTFDDGSMQFITSEIGVFTASECDETKTLKEIRSILIWKMVFLSTNFGSSFVEDNFCINDFTELLEKDNDQFRLDVQPMNYFKHRFQIIISKSKGNIRNVQTFLSSRWTIGWWWRTIGCNRTCWLRWMRWRWIRLTLKRHLIIERWINWFSEQTCSLGDNDCVLVWLLFVVVGDKDILTVSVSWHVESTRSFDVLFVVDA